MNLRDEGEWENEVGRQPVELRLKARPDFALLDRSHPLDQKSK
jgi:hypothetical protein